MNLSLARGVAAFAMLSLCLGGCGGGADAPLVALPGATPTASPGTTPTPVPGAPGTLAVKPVTLTFIATGAAAAQTFAAAETGYTGAMSESNTCSNIATVAPTGGTTGANVGYAVTPTAGGTCVVTVVDAFKQKATLTVSITASGLVVQ